VEGVSTPFTFTSTSVINISPAPTGDVVVYRTTPIEDKVTTFVDGSAFLAAEANQQNDQFLFALQEGIDSLGSAQASAAAALASETAAALSEAAAAASESAAATSESNALTYKNTAVSSASAANLSDISATSAANTATAKAILTAADAVATAADRAAVAADKSTVDGYKVAAAASAAAALVSENAAAASAAALPNGAATGAGKVPQWNGSAWVGTTALVSADIGVSVQGYDATTLKSSAIGVTVQGYDANTVKKNAANTFSAAQQATATTDNDLSFALGTATNFFECTPTADGALTFTGRTSSRQSGLILLVNGSNYAISAAANTKISSTDLATISATGTYLLTYYDNGTNTYVVCSRSFT
jgi:hypothetical protein